MRVFLMLVFLVGYFMIGSQMGPLYINAINIVWFLFSCFYIGYIYFKEDKEYDNSKKIDYMTTIPSDKPPEIIGFLMSCSIKKEYLIASIMELIRKEVILIGKINKSNKYVLIHNNKVHIPLSKAENYVIKWLFHDIGNDSQVSIDSIKKHANKSNGYFHSCYHEWSDIVNIEGAKYNFFESKKNFIETIFVYFITSYVMSLYNMFGSSNLMIGILMFILTTLFVIYTNTFYKRTKDGNIEHNEWMAFKRYISKYDNTIHEYGIYTLSMYGIYSKVLGVENEYRNILRKKYETNKEDVDTNMLLCAINTGVIDILDKTISGAISRSELMYAFSSRNKGNSYSRRKSGAYKYTLITEKE